MRENVQKGDIKSYGHQGKMNVRHQTVGVHDMYAVNKSRSIVDIEDGKREGYGSHHPHVKAHGS